MTQANPMPAPERGENSVEIDSLKSDETPDVASLEAKADEEIRTLFGVNLDSLGTRRRLALRHPMLDGKYAIATEEVLNLRDVCFDWVANRKSGLFVCGLHRQGKTTAMNEVIDHLHESLPFIAILQCIAERNPRQTKRQFCIYLLSQLGYRVAAIKRDTRVETVLANLLMTRSAEAGGAQCVLFIDEAQLFSVVQYRYLLEIWNEVRRNGYIFGTVLVGQPDLRLLKALTTESDHGAVVSRFFVKEYGFGGIKSERMLRELLSHYDSDLVFPEGSKWPYSRFFLQEGYDRGWRLENEASLLWEALCRISQEKKSAIKSSGFRMAWIIDAIHSFLVDGMSQDVPKFKGTIDMWEECILDGTDAELIV